MRLIVHYDNMEDEDVKFLNEKLKGYHATLSYMGKALTVVAEEDYTKTMEIISILSFCQHQDLTLHQS